MTKKIIAFKAAWCAPCKRLTPILEEIAKEQNIEIEFIDVSDNPDMFDEYAVQSIPTLKLLDDNLVIGTLVGETTKEKIIEFIQL